MNPFEDYTEETMTDGTTATVTLQAGMAVDVYTGSLPCTDYGDDSLSWFGGHLLFPEDL